MVHFNPDFPLYDESVKVLVAQSCPTLCDPMDCGPTGSHVHGIFPARILEQVAISFSRRSSQPRDQIWVFHIAGRFFTIWATRKAVEYVKKELICEYWFYILLSCWIDLWLKNFFLYCSIVDLQCCVSFCYCKVKWVSYKYTYIHSQIQSPYRSLQSTVSWAI